MGQTGADDNEDQSRVYRSVVHLTLTGFIELPTGPGRREKEAASSPLTPAAEIPRQAHAKKCPTGVLFKHI